MPNFHKYFSIIFACFREFLFLKIPSWPLSPSFSNTGTTLLGHKRKIPSSRNCLSLTASLSEIIRQLHICHNSLANMWMILICSNHSGFSTAHVILFQLLSWPQIFKHLCKKLSALLFMAAIMNYYKFGHLKNINLFSHSYGSQKYEIKVLAGLRSLGGYRGNSFLASLSVSSGDSYSLICSHIISMFVSVITWPPSRSTSLIRILIIGLKAHLHNTVSPYTLDSKFLIICTKISFSFTGSRK